MLRATVATQSLILIGCDAMRHAADFAKFPCVDEKTDWRMTVERVSAISIPAQATVGKRVVTATLPDGRTMIADKAEHFSLTFTPDFSDVRLALWEGFCHADLYHYLYTAHAFAHHLLACNGGGVHSAGFVRGGKAVLLIGASGVGKSTMLDRVTAVDPSVAVLCEDINAVLRENGGYRVYGTPFCGEDTRCENADAPLGAIVILKKEPQNRIEKADFPAAMFGLTQSILRPTYAPHLCEAAADLAVALARDIPVFVFENDGTQQAGEMLLAALDDNG